MASENAASRLTLNNIEVDNTACTQELTSPFTALTAQNEIDKFERAQISVKVKFPEPIPL